MEYIFEVDDIVPRVLCEEIIEKFENDPNKSVGVMSGGVCKKGDEQVLQTLNL